MSAKALNVETKLGSGAQVGEMWAKRKEMAKYCLQDAFVTHGCCGRMTFRNLHHRAEILRSPELIDVDGFPSI